MEGLKDDKVQVLFDPHTTYKAEVLDNEGDYLLCPPEDLTCRNGSTFLSSTDPKEISHLDVAKCFVF